MEREKREKKEGVEVRSLENKTNPSSFSKAQEKPEIASSPIMGEGSFETASQLTLSI